MKSIKDLDIMQTLNFTLIGERICEKCDSKVPVYEKNGEKISHCLNCERLKLSKELTEGYEPPKRRLLSDRAKAIEFIPSDLEYVTFDDYIPKTESQMEAKQISLDYIKGKHTAILLNGDPGTGKSHLFRCIARELEKQTVDWKENGRTYKVRKIALFAKVPELMKLIQRTYNNKKIGLTEEIILDTLATVDVLILDEIAGERSKREPNGFETWSGDIIYQILDRRQGKQNLYNLNYSSAEVKKKYDETPGKRILSRMASGAKMLKVDGPDHRMKGAN
ncbi:AAA family ATPase [Oceanobacillus salinisoli]|uniref:AAA family ATPase n=1 Tax=Oceanobacillus salinisoli TaxID=2678611 RepID=UPI0012E2563F|nr:AAA family ATPase [Oceanobacillus salinisoli]